MTLERRLVMEPRIEILDETLLVGETIRMSLADNKTKALWQTFMPGLGEVNNRIGHKLYSVEIYGEGYFDQLNPHAEFEKWAAVQVRDFDGIPGHMKTLRVPTGLYAVFLHRGPASSGPQTYQYIFGTWVPNSDYLLDTRPHLAIMGEHYNPNDPNAEETLWIPIKPK
jgi:AraC family transcriptional regulator